MTLHPGLSERFFEDMRRRLSEKSAFTLHMLHVLHMSDVSEEKDIRRKIATVRCICNAGLHHCNGWMHLQPSVAPPHPVGARIARPFVPDVITAIFREGARRVIGATAKPLYPIDGKAEGLDRRSPKDLPLRGRGTARRRWKEFPRIAPPITPSRALSKPLIQPRVQGRNPARFNGGYGVPRGFKGEKFEISP